MDSQRKRLRRAYDERYVQTLEDGFYFPVAPFHGFGSEDSEAGQLAFLARSFQILRTASRLDFRTCLDVGGGEAFHCMQFSSLFEAVCINGDLSIEGVRRGRQFGPVRGLVLEAEQLPFADRSFDLVLCSNVLDEVEDVGRVLRELRRVSAGALIVTCADVAHFDRSLFEAELGGELGICSLYDADIPCEELDEYEARDWLAEHACDDLRATGIGVLVANPGAGGRFISSQTDRELLQALFEFRLPAERPSGQ